MTCSHSQQLNECKRSSATARTSFIQLYAEFLSDIDDVEIRSALERPGDTEIDTIEYQQLADKAREFKDELLSLLLDDLGAGMKSFEHYCFERRC